MAGREKTAFLVLGILLCVWSAAGIIAGGIAAGSHVFASDDSIDTSIAKVLGGVEIVASVVHAIMGAVSIAAFWAKNSRSCWPSGVIITLAVIATVLTIVLNAVPAFYAGTLNAVTSGCTSCSSQDGDGYNYNDGYAYGSGDSYYDGNANYYNNGNGSYDAGMTQYDGFGSPCLVLAASQGNDCWYDRSIDRLRDALTAATIFVAIGTAIEFALSIIGCVVCCRPMQQPQQVVYQMAAPQVALGMPVQSVPVAGGGGGAAATAAPPTLAPPPMVYAGGGGGGGGGKNPSVIYPTNPYAQEQQGGGGAPYHAAAAAPYPPPAPPAPAAAGALPYPPAPGRYAAQ